MNIKTILGALLLVSTAAQAQTEGLLLGKKGIEIGFKHVFWQAPVAYNSIRFGGKYPCSAKCSIFLSLTHICTVVASLGVSQTCNAALGRLYLPSASAGGKPLFLYAFLFGSYKLPNKKVAS